MKCIKTKCEYYSDATQEQCEKCNNNNKTEIKKTINSNKDKNKTIQKEE